jgi:hypothetical protein
MTQSDLFIMNKRAETSSKPNPLAQKGTTRAVVARFCRNHLDHAPASTRFAFLQFLLPDGFRNDWCVGLIV